MGSATTAAGNVLVDLDVPHRVLTLTLNRPETKNAWNDDVYLEVRDLLNNAATDERVGVVVLTGSGDFFSSGQDLKRVGDRKYAKLNMRHHPVGLFMWAMMHFPKPIIGAINGPAVGVGVTLIPHCDVVYATRNAFFLTPFARIGFVPEFVCTLTLREIVGPSLANEMLLSCKRLTAEEALRTGLVSALYDTPNEVRAAAQAVARQMTSFPVSDKTLPLFKRMGKYPQRMKDLEAAFDMEMDALTENGRGGNAIKNAQAFLQTKAKRTSNL